MFGEDYFGSVTTGPDHIIKTGRFAYLPVRRNARPHLMCYMHRAPPRLAFKYTLKKFGWAYPLSHLCSHAFAHTLRGLPVSRT